MDQHSPWTEVHRQSISNWTQWTPARDFELAIYDTARVSVSGDLFYLSEAQITRDQPNLFTKHIPWVLGQQRPAQGYVFHADRDSTLFRVVQQYLRGYDIFPLNPSQFLTSHLATLRNLLADARFYELKKLEALVQAEIARVERDERDVEGYSVMSGDTGSTISWARM